MKGRGWFLFCQYFRGFSVSLSYRMLFSSGCKGFLWEGDISRYCHFFSWNVSRALKWSRQLDKPVCEWNLGQRWMKVDQLALWQMPIAFVYQQEQGRTSDFSSAMCTLRGYLENFPIHSENVEKLSFYWSAIFNHFGGTAINARMITIWLCLPSLTKTTNLSGGTALRFASSFWPRGSHDEKGTTGT